MIYRLIKTFETDKLVCVLRVEANAFIPFDSANSDFQQFKLDVMDAVELQDADGQAMSAQSAIEFVSNLP